MKTIWLTKGAVAFVDDNDYEAVASHSWYFQQTGSGYAARTDERGEKKLFILMHREIMAPGIGLEVDHINGDGLDNRRSNLRVCTHGSNMKNKAGIRRYRFKGVTRRTGHKSFYAEIITDGLKRHLGAFATEELAARAYDGAARKYHGDFARLNFPDEQAAA